MSLLLWLLLLLALFTVGHADSPSDGRPMPEVVKIVRKLRETMTSEEKEDPVIVSESNSRFHRMTRWWIDGMKKLDPPIDKFVIVALDPVEHHRLKKMNQTVAWNRMNMNWTATGFRTNEYNKIVNYKWQIVVDLLKDGHNLLLTDVDIYWRKNPMKYLRSLPQCDMYLTVDIMGLPPDDKSPQEPKPPRIWPPFGWEGFENRANTGFCFLRSRPAVIKLAEKVLAEPLPGMDDQFTFNTHFNKLLNDNRANSEIAHGPNNCAHYGDLTFHMLRPDWFQNRLIHIHNPQWDNEYYMLHFNWLGDFTEKMNAMIGGGFMNATYRRYR